MGNKRFKCKSGLVYTGLTVQFICLQDRNDIYTSLYTIKWYLQCFLDRVRFLSQPGFITVAQIENFLKSSVFPQISNFK